MSWSKRLIDYLACVIDWCPLTSNSKFCGCTTWHAAPRTPLRCHQMSGTSNGSSCKSLIHRDGASCSAHLASQEATLDRLLPKPEEAMLQVLTHSTADQLAVPSAECGHKHAHANAQHNATDTGSCAVHYSTIPTAGSANVGASMDDNVSGELLAVLSSPSPPPVPVAMLNGHWRVRCA